MNREIRMRLKWVRLFEQTSDAGLVCRTCGISRPTFRRWLRRYKEEGIDGLQSKSHPKSSSGRKVFAVHELGIPDLRAQRKLGARRLQKELRRHHDCVFALPTINEVLAER